VGNISHSIFSKFQFAPNPSKMSFLKIVAIALCVVGLQLSAEAKLSDKDLLEIYRQDLKHAGEDTYFSTEASREILDSMLHGDTKSQTDTAYEFLNNAWRVSEDSKRVLKALGSLREYIARHQPRKCDLNVYDQLLSIVRMSDKYFEEHTNRHALARMLLFKMHDAFVANCVQKLRTDLHRFYGKNRKEMSSLGGFESFLDGETLDLVGQETYPDNSPSMMNKLNLVSKGDKAWYQLMKRATVELTAGDEARYKETLTMPRKESIAVKFGYVVDNGCVLLSQNEGFQAFLDELSGLSKRLVFDLVEHKALEQQFQELQKYLGMYKICMRLRDFDRNGLMEKVEQHTRRGLAN